MPKQVFTRFASFEEAPPLITIKETEFLYRASRSKIQRLIKDGQLETVTIGGSVLIITASAKKRATPVSSDA